MANYLEATYELATENFGNGHLCRRMSVSVLFFLVFMMLKYTSTIAASSARVAELYISGNRLLSGSMDITCKSRHY